MEAGEQKVTADTPYFEVKTQFIQKYLLEEFTGHTCLNCPKAHKTMQELQQNMKDTLICMAVHCGIFAEPGDAPYTADYRTPMGNYIEKYFPSIYNNLSSYVKYFCCPEMKGDHKWQTLILA